MDRGVIGRDEELALARAFLDGAGAGPRALVVEGEAGIGKTAVWLATLEEAAVRGCRVLRCAGEESEARLSFVGLSDLIGDTADEFLPALPAPQREALEVALLRKTSTGRGPEPRAVAMALRSLLVEAAREQPVVVAVDDVQWLDAASVELHMDVGASAFRRFADLIEMDGIEVYGEASDRMFEQLQQKAHDLGEDGSVRIAQLQAGFSRIAEAAGQPHD